VSEARYAAIYARISTNKQSQLSPESQIRKCQEAAAARGFRVTDRHIYRDDGISGVGADRPAFQRMMAAALTRPCPFDAIFVDDTSRLSRTTEDALSIFRALSFAGIQLVAVSQSIDSMDDQADVLMTVHGLVDSLYVKELRKKVHRGLDERALRGLHTGGRCYGYTTVESDGGKRVVVNDSQADVVRQIFRMSSEGCSLKSIAKKLNAQGISAPCPRRDRVQRGWCPTAIREMLRNQRYIGRIVWNRSRFVKVPGTNSRVARHRPESEWRTRELPDQRIVSDELWTLVQMRQRWLNDNFTKGGHRGLLSRNVSSRFLFSGLLYCAECGSRLTVICGHGKKNYRRYGCSRNFNRGTCSNNLRERQDRIETQLLEGLQKMVLHPDVVDYTLRRFEQDLGRHLQAARGRLDQIRERRRKLESELRNLTATAAQTGPSAFLVGEIASRERELRDVTDQLVDGGPASEQETIEELRRFVRSQLADIRQVLNAEVEQARAEIARHAPRIEMRRVTPPSGRRHYIAAGEWNLLGTALDKGRAPHLLGGGARMVAGGRFELTSFGL
jgi:site-specific DNA recombinase